jgi:hypothetical protein
MPCHSFEKLNRYTRFINPFCLTKYRHLERLLNARLSVFSEDMSIDLVDVSKVTADVVGHFLILG